MTVAFAVSFEFETRAPLTHRGRVSGSSAATCVARATRIAQAALRPVAWSSVVCVLLERVPADAPEASPPPTPVADELSNTTHASHLPPRANSLRKSATPSNESAHEQHEEQRNGRP